MTHPEANLATSSVRHLEKVKERAVAGPSSTRLLHLDVLRGVAILLVLGQHTPAVLKIHPTIDAISDHFHHYGYLGVDIFFVLSGFLIGGLLFGEIARTNSLDAKRFLVRRAFKIWPSYLICLTTCCLITGLLQRDSLGVPTTFRQIFTDMWPAYLHVQNYFSSTSRFAVFWSLGVEEHFYLILPICLLLICQMRPDPGLRSPLSHVIRLGIGVGLFCLAARWVTVLIWPHFGGYTHYFPTHLRMDSLMAGVVLAAIARFAPERLEPLRPWRWIFALVALGLFVLPRFLPGGRYDSLYPFDCSLVIVGASGLVLMAYFADRKVSAVDQPFTLRWFIVGWATRLVALIGFFSYPIYLWHGYFGPAFTKRVMDLVRIPVGGSGVASVAHLLVYVLVSIAMGVASHWVIERPFLRLRDQFFPSRGKLSVPNVAPRPTP